MEVEVENFIARMRVALALTTRLVPSTLIVSDAGFSTSLRVRAANKLLTFFLDILIEAVRANVELFTQVVSM